MQTAMLMPAAIAAKKKRWAIVYPNFEYGQSAAATFKEMLKKAQPDVEFVTEQAPPLGKVDAGAVVQAIDDAKPDAIFNVLFGADLAKFVREGNTRGVFKDRTVVSLLSGEPEYLDPLKDETPVGWIVTGYPWDKIKTPEHDAFLDRLPEEVQRLSAARFDRRLRHDQVDRRRHRQGQARPTPRSWSRRSRASRSTARSVRSPIAPATIRRRWAPMSARSRSRTARAPWSTSNMSMALSVLPTDAEVKKLRPAAD